MTHELNDFIYGVMTLRHQFLNDAVCVVADADPLRRTRCLVDDPSPGSMDFIRGIRSKRARLERGTSMRGWLEWTDAPR